MPSTLAVLTDPLLTGGVVAVALGAFKLIERFLPAKNGASVPKDYHDKMMEFRRKMLDTHVGPGALDPRTGLPRWWGGEIVEVLKQIRDKGVGQETVRSWSEYAMERDALIERLLSRQTEQLKIQTVALDKIHGYLDSCEYCKDSHGVK